MKLFELLRELRRNPEVNTAKQGHGAAVEFLKKIPEDDLENYGVSMTHIPKLGVNPQSKYNTPLGIYFYPAEHYLNLKQDNRSLEFQDSAPYIQILKLDGTYLNLGQYTDADYVNDLRGLTNVADQIGKMIYMDESDVVRKISRLDRASSEYAKVGSAAGKFWYVVWQLSRESGQGHRSSAAPRSSVVWNKIFRLLGIDGIIDPGTSVIHDNEPAQGVVLNPRSVRLVKTFENKVHQSSSNSQNLNPFSSMMKYQASSPKEYVQYVINQMVGLYPEDTVGFEGLMKKVAEKVAQNLDKDPTAYDDMMSSDLRRLLRLANNDPKLTEKFTVGFYGHRFMSYKDDIKELLRIEKMDVPAKEKAQLLDIYLRKFLPIRDAIKPYAHNEDAQTMLDILKRFSDLKDELEKAPDLATPAANPAPKGKKAAPVATAPATV